MYWWRCCTKFSKKKPKIDGIFYWDKNREFKIWRAKIGGKVRNCKECKAEKIRLESPWSTPPQSLTKDFRISIYWEATQFLILSFIMFYIVALHIVSYGALVLEIF